MSLARRLRTGRGGFVRDAGALTAAEGVIACVAIAQGVLLARWLGPAGYGLVALANAMPATVLALLSPDSIHATVRYLAEREAAGDSRGALSVLRLATLVDAGIGAAMLLGVAAAAPVLVARVLHGEGPGWLIVGSAAGMAIAAPSEAATAVLMHSRRFGRLAGLRIAGTLLRAALAVGLVASGHGVGGAVAAGAVGSGLLGVAIFVAGSTEARRRWGGSWLAVPTAALGDGRREMLRFLAWTDLAGLLGTVTKQLDVVIVGSVAGTAEAGAYRLARSLAGVMGYVVGPLQTAVYPRLAALWAGASDLRAVLRRHVLLGAALGAGVFPGVALVGPVVRTLVGSQFDRAIPAAQLLLGASCVWMAMYWLRPLYMAAGEVRVWVAISAAMVAASLAAFGPVAAAWGAVGMAGVQLAATLVGHGIAAVRVTRLVGLQHAPRPAGVTP